MTTRHTGNSISRLPLRCRFFVLAIALCWFALSSALQAVSPPPDGGYGGNNTAEGTDALFSLTTGVWNVAVGFQALHSDTAGNQNTATGYRALFSNIGGNKSTAYGAQALYNNLSGNDNVANGFSSLFTNTTGNRNTGNGFRTLLFNNGDDNTGIGWNALFNNRGGNENTATGSGALLHGSGNNNTATGFQALNNNNSNNNTAVGSQALLNNVDGSENTVVGAGSGNNLVAGFNNTYVGHIVGTGVPDENSTIRINDLSGGDAQECYIGGIFNNFQPVGGTVVEVTLDLADDHLGWDVGPSQSVPNVPSRGVPARRGAPGASSQRPTNNTNQKAMLNDKVDKLQVVVQMQQRQIVALTAQLKEQAAQIEKVSTQVEMGKPAPQTIATNP